jgi:uncharacterized membrane protein YjdF
MSTMRKTLWPLIAFTLAYMSAAVYGVIATGNREFVFYLIIMLVLIGLVWSIHRRIQLTMGMLWALSIWGLLHMAGGLVKVPLSWPYEPPNAVLYSLWLIPHYLKYDQLVHAFGFGVTTWICWHGWRAIAGSTLRPTFGVLTLCVAAGMGFGAANEIIEFIAVLSIPNTNVGGYVNTGWDLISNATGAIIAAILIRLRSR